MRRKLVLLAVVLAVAPATQVAHARSCLAGPYIIFFDADSPVLKKAAIEVLEFMIEHAGDCGPSEVLLSGHADVPEVPTIARARLRAVRNFLESRGLFVRPRNMRSFGSTQLRMQAEGLPEAQNRRVELMFGPPNPR